MITNEYSKGMTTEIDVYIESRNNRDKVNKNTRIEQRETLTPRFECDPQKIPNQQRKRPRPECTNLGSENS